MHGRSATTQRQGDLGRPEAVGDSMHAALVVVDVDHRRTPGTDLLDHAVGFAQHAAVDGSVMAMESQELLLPLLRGSHEERRCRAAAVATATAVWLGAERE